MNLLSWILGREDNDDTAPVEVSVTSSRFGGDETYQVNVGRMVAPDSSKDDEDVLYYDKMTPEQKAEYGIHSVDGDNFLSRLFERLK